MKYIRVNITAEGQAEMEFAKRTLSAYFAPKGIVINTRCVLVSKNKHRTYRGGLIDYERAKKDITNWLKEDSTALFTTMFDLYALPDNFPGYAEAQKMSNIYDKVTLLEDAFKQDIGYPNFFPYIQLHEFEALLLSDPDALLLEYPDAQHQVEQLKRIVSQHNDNPEEVNQGAHTAPSKRIINLIPAYKGNKVSVGAELAGINGIEFQKQKCKHFAEWIDKIESFAA